VQVIRQEGVTTFFGAPAFLQDMVRTDLAGDPSCPLKCLVIAGSSVPRGLPAQAQEALGAYICPAWGMTECSIIVSCTPTEPDTIQSTDGSVFAGSEARVVDENGEDVAVGEVGDLLVRGPSVIYGYYDRPDATADAFAPGLWFKTGDRASLDEHGWLSLRGRTKDIIIRGGENIPVTDVESIIFDHPDVLNAAVVGMPDDRLGERVCAVLVVKAGSPEPTVATLGDYLLSQGLSKHYLPERVVALPELPMTPSGKIQKFKLREMIV
jgi:cyclohexanecarboxylate-CoA ligase